MLIKTLLKTFNTNRTFLIAYGFLLLLGLYPFFKWDQVSIALFINTHHHPWLDTFFYYITNLGDGIAYGLLVMVLFFLRIPYRQLIAGLGSFCSMSVVVQFLKRVVFYHHLRPIKVVPLTTSVDQLHLIDKVDILTHLSFPSGHTATIFTAVCFLSLLYGYLGKKKSKGISNLKNETNLGSEGAVSSRDALFKNLPGITLVWLGIALLVSYSRMYLFQHFYKDVYFGALIGVFTTCIVYAIWIYSNLPQWFMGILPPRLTRWLAFTLRE